MEHSSELCGAIFWAGLTLVVGTSLAVWGYLILRDPSRLRKGSLMYRWLQTSTWKWGKEDPPDHPQELSHRQIRFWAVMAILAGIITALGGIGSLLETMVHFP